VGGCGRVERGGEFFGEELGCADYVAETFLDACCFRRRDIWIEGRLLNQYTILGYKDGDCNGDGVGIGIGEILRRGCRILWSGICFR
jgi:hypothetical protein